MLFSFYCSLCVFRIAILWILFFLLFYSSQHIYVPFIVLSTTTEYPSVCAVHDIFLAALLSALFFHITYSLSVTPFVAQSVQRDVSFCSFGSWSCCCYHSSSYTNDSWILWMGFFFVYLIYWCADAFIINKYYCVQPVNFLLFILFSAIIDCSWSLNSMDISHMKK